MKLTNTITALAVLTVSLVTASAYQVTNGAEFLNNPVSSADGSELLAGEFTLRLGTFTFNTSNFAANNAAVVAAADSNNLSLLNSNFVSLYNFNPAEQAEGDTGDFDEVNGAVGVDAGGPGLIYAYQTASSNTAYGTTYSALLGENMYAWIQSTSNPSEMLIITGNATFAPSNDPFNASANLVTGENIAGLQVLVGNDRTATASNDYQLEVVPEPSTYALVGGALVAVVLFRRRKISA